MRPRALLGAFLALGALSLGLATAWIAAENHGHARELDRRQHAADALEVLLERRRLEALAAEEELLAKQRVRPAPAPKPGGDL